MSPRYSILGAACLVLLVVGWSAACASALSPSQSSRRQVLAGSAAAAAGIWTNAANAIVSDSKNDKIYMPPVDSLQGQTIVITGGTSGLGLESAKRLSQAGATVILTARTDAKGAAAVAEVQQYLAERQIRNLNVSYKVLNLDDLEAVKKAPSTWNDVQSIDVLMNNAGVMAIPDKELTKDGYELQIQTNHLGHFVLTALLQSKLAPNARIVNVSSLAYQFVNQLQSDDDLWNPSKYGPWAQYGQSKLANILFTEELQRRSEAAGKQWTVVSLHPGAVATDLGRYLVGPEKWDKFKQGQASFWEKSLLNLANNFILTVPEGASTQVYLAARADEVTNTDVKGKFLSDRKVQKLPAFATDSSAAQRLWKESEERAGIQFKI